MDIEKLSGAIIGAAYTVHNELGGGFLERVYENALRIELKREGFNVEQQKPITVQYRGEPVGEFFADLLVEGRLIVELKALTELAKEHEVQVVNYLVATGIEDGLLLNFSPEKVGIRRKYRTHRKSENRIDT
jgi:GxxExxY protein